MGGELFTQGTACIAWLIIAYKLEMVGEPRYRELFAASVVFFAANIHFIRGVIKNYIPGWNIDIDVNMRGKKVK